MSEPQVRARRVVAVGAAALVVVIVALSAAAWRLVEAEEAAADARGRTAAASALDDVVRWVAGEGIESLSVQWNVPSDGRDSDPAARPRFAPTPTVADPEAVFWLAAAGDFSGDLRRAALRRALSSQDAAARLAAAAEGVRLELREKTGRVAEWTKEEPMGALARTRDGVFLGLVAAAPRAPFRASDWPSALQLAFLALDGPDDAAAASMLAALLPDGAALVRRAHAQHAEAALLRAAFRRAPEVDGRSRAVFLDDGDALSAQRSRDVKTKWGGWDLARVPRERALGRIREMLAYRGLVLVEGDAASAATAVALPGDPRLAIAAPLAREDARSRSTLLLAGLGVAALAAVGAFGAFAVAVRRDARLATLRTEFVATVSHELRTPVAVVRTSAETLASGRATKDEDRQALTAAIVRESERLSDLVGNVLDFARMESGRRKYAFRDADLGALVRDVAGRHAGVAVEVGDALAPLRCDPDAVAAAVGNLLDNAAKFSSGARCALRTYSSDDFVVLEVEDHGIGVPDAEKTKIFERFFRGADPRVQETRGAGIGLALVAHAAAAHGGRVEVADTPGGGATFRFVLPRRQDG